MTSTAPTKIPTHVAESFINSVLAAVDKVAYAMGEPDERTSKDLVYAVLALVGTLDLTVDRIEIQGSPKSLMDQADTFRLGLEASLAFAPANATDSERNTISIMMTEASADLRRTAVDALEMLDYLSMGRLYFRADALGRFNAALNNLTAVHTLTRALKDRA